MKRTLFALVALVAVLCATSVAAATVGRHHRNPQVLRLNNEVKVLRHRLHKMTIARGRAKAALATAQGQIASLQGQIASLQGEVGALQTTLAKRTGERDAARAQVASLHAQLAAIPTPVAAAEQEISREIWQAERDDPTRSVGEITSLAVMNYVAVNVSFFTRGYFIGHGLPVAGETPGYPATANNMLGTHAGECGQHAIVFATLMRHFGYTVRSVQFYYDDPPGSPNGHVAPEVYYDGGWHFFDPSFDLYWTNTADGNVLSISDVRADGGVEYKGNALLLNVILNARDASAIAHGNNITWFETDPTTTVVLGAASLNG